MRHTKSKSHVRPLVNSASARIRMASPLPVIDAALTQARTTTRRVIDHTVAYAHDHPDKALVYALVAGYMLRTVAVTRVLSGVLRIAQPLIKPAALYYGISKVVLSRPNGSAALMWRMRVMGEDAQSAGRHQPALEAGGVGLSAARRPQVCSAHEPTSRVVGRND